MEGANRRTSPLSGKGQITEPNPINRIEVQHRTEALRTKGLEAWCRVLWIRDNPVSRVSFPYALDLHLDFQF